MTRTQTDREWTAEYLGRLWELPLVSLRRFERPIPELWERAPAGLRKRASRPLTPVRQEVWRVLRDPKRLGTEACFHVPLWIPEWKRGYLLDFFFPEYGVNLQLDPWDPSYLAEEFPEVDFDAEPDHPLNEERDDLLVEQGIEVFHLWDEVVNERGADEVRLEVRRELGIGRPPWLERTTPGSSPAP